MTPVAVLVLHHVKGNGGQWVSGFSYRSTGVSGLKTRFLHPRASSESQHRRRLKQRVLPQTLEHLGSMEIHWRGHVLSGKVRKENE